MFEAYVIAAAMLGGGEFAGPDALLGHTDCSEHGCAHMRSALARMRAEAFEGASPLTARGVLDDTDVLHHDLAIEIDPVSETIDASDVITVKSLTDGLTEFTFELRSNFTISSLTVDGSSVSYSRNGIKEIVVTLPRAYASDETFDLAIAYSGSPVAVGFGAFLWDSHNGIDLVSTLSEPWYSYSWRPVKESNRDRATADMSYTVPSWMTVAANGSLESVENLSGSRKRFNFSTQYTMPPYLMAFAATNYDEFSDTWTYPGVPSMPLQFYIWPEWNTSGNRAAWLETKEMLTVFSDLFGVYPFADEKYGIYQFGFGGGMEHQTMTGQGTFNESVTAHELGHQWWGDMITCAEWNDIWLNEGFATYSEALWAQYKPGSSGEPALHAHMDFRRPSSFSGSAYQYDTSSAGALFDTNNVYRRGGWVLHMLRHVIGDADFFGSLQAYRQAFEGGSATTADFQAVVESVWGGDLTWFFDTWVYDNGAPTYWYSPRSIMVNGERYVELYVRQAQSASYPLFTMPLDVKLNSLQGNATATVWNDAQVEHYVIPASFAPSSVVLDPDKWVLTQQKAQVGFIEGPPKIVQSSPAPDAELATGPSVLEVTFHKHVSIAPADVTLTGDIQGSVPVSMTYNATTQTATIMTIGALAPDAYVLTIDDGVSDVAAGLALDGEMNVVTPLSSGGLPSGDGQPGGDAHIAFSVLAPTCPGDATGDGAVNFDDLNAVLSNWGTNDPDGDLDDSGAVDFDDLNIVLSNWGIAC